MHLGRFHAMITDIIREWNELSIENALSNVASHLQSVASNPGNADVAVGFKAALEALRTSTSQSMFSSPRPIVKTMLESINADRYVAEGLFLRVKEAIEANQFTPALAFAAVNRIQSKFAEFKSDLTTIDSLFTKLDVEYDDLNYGEGEVGLLIPRDENSSKLEDLAKELKQWNNALSPMVEIFDRDAPPLTITTFSTTDWMLYLAATPPVLFGVSTCLKGLNSILREMNETKRLLLQLTTNTSLPTEKIKELESVSENQVKGKIDDFAQKIIDENYKGDTARGNELRNALVLSLKTIIGKLSTGAKVELRYLPDEPPPKTTDSEGNETNTDALQDYHQQVALAEQLDNEVEQLTFSCDIPLSLIEDQSAGHEEQSS